MHVEFTLWPGTKAKAPPLFYSKRMNTTGSSVLLFSLLSAPVPVCRVSPANERGDGRGGWVYLLTGHLRPGEQRLGQLLHQTGALRSQSQDRAGWTGSGHTSGNPQRGSGMWRVKLALNHTQTNATGLLWSQNRRQRGRGGGHFHSSEKSWREQFSNLVAVRAHNHSRNLYDWLESTQGRTWVTHIWAFSFVTTQHRSFLSSLKHPARQETSGWIIKTTPSRQKRGSRKPTSAHPASATIWAAHRDL